MKSLQEDAEESGIEVFADRRTRKSSVIMKKFCIECLSLEPNRYQRYNDQVSSSTRSNIPRSENNDNSSFISHSKKSSSGRDDHFQYSSSSLKRYGDGDDYEYEKQQQERKGNQHNSIGRRGDRDFSSSEFGMRNKNKRNGSDKRKKKFVKKLMMENDPPKMSDEWDNFGKEWKEEKTASTSKGKD